MGDERPSFRMRLSLIGFGVVLLLLYGAYLSLRDDAPIIQSPEVLVSQTTAPTEDNNVDKYVPPPLRGQWVHVGSNRTFAAPVCCGWDKGDFKHHPQECGTKRSDEEYYVGPPANNGVYQQMGGMACRKESGKKDKINDEWEWQSPDLPLFDAHATCQQLRNRTVLLLGDSTMQQTAATLMNALKVGGCAPQVKLQLSDTLIHRELGNLNRGVHFRNALSQHQPDIAIMNAGAHVRTEYNYTRMLDEVIRGLQEWREKPEENSKPKPVAIVWKTQQPGGCTSKIVHPDDPVRAALKFNYSQTPRYRLYEYDNFYRRDLYTMKRWKAELGHDAHILDMRMLYSRSDAHPGSGQTVPNDCLHFTAPGPLDVVAPLFQRLLTEIDRAR